MLPSLTDIMSEYTQIKRMLEDDGYKIYRIYFRENKICLVFKKVTHVLWYEDDEWKYEVYKNV